MNDKANEVLLQLLNKAMAGIDAAVQFSQAQIPDVVHQLLVWNFTKSVIFTIFALATIPPVIWFLRKMLKREVVGVVGDEGYYWRRGQPKYKPTLIWDEDGNLDPSALFLIIPITLWALLLVVAVGNMTWLKIWLAPKLYLLEYAASLVK